MSFFFLFLDSINIHFRAIWIAYILTTFTCISVRALKKAQKQSNYKKKYPWLIYIIFGKMYLGQLEEPRERREWKARGSWEKRGRDSHAMGKCFGETKLRERKAGHKGLWKWQTVPLTCALKEMLPLMPRRGEMIGEREWKEKEERKEKKRSRQKI